MSSFSSIVFGDVFEYNCKNYIFLAKSEDVLYVAEILDLEKSRKLDRSCSTAIRRNKKITNPLFCYVKLRTEEFKNRLAHCGWPGTDILPIEKLEVNLEKEDIKEIYREITNEKSPVPAGLKKLVRELDIKV